MNRYHKASIAMGGIALLMFAMLVFMDLSLNMGVLALAIPQYGLLWLGAREERKYDVEL